MGSDLDVVLIVADSDQPFEVRAGRWDLTSLPVPVETLVYTIEEWQALHHRDDRFSRMLATGTAWELREVSAAASLREMGHAAPPCSPCPAVSP